jgi:hypothetical protein
MIGNTSDKESKLESTRTTSTRTSRCEHTCSLGDRISTKAWNDSKHKLRFDGPCEITQVNNDGAVHFQKGTVNDAVNIRRIEPCHKQSAVSTLNHPSLITGASAADLRCSKSTCNQRRQTRPLKSDMPQHAESDQSNTTGLTPHAVTARVVWCRQQVLLRACSRQHPVAKAPRTLCLTTPLLKWIFSLQIKQRMKPQTDVTLFITAILALLFRLRVVFSPFEQSPHKTAQRGATLLHRVFAAS